MSTIIPSVDLDHRRSVAERLAQLFAGNPRSHGAFHPRKNPRAKDRLETIHSAATIEDFEQHLAGVRGMGSVPILDNGECNFGVIDIDAHGDDTPDIDIVGLEQTIREKNLPLVVCRSKSGGAHLYLFMAEPAKAKLVRTVLAKWAEQIGYAGVEVFPKQDELLVVDGEQIYGNWINLCYFDAFNPEQKRYALEGGKQVPVEYFLELAEARRVMPSTLVEKAEGEHAEAPPCIQKMISNGVGQGMRNEGLYNVVVYLKQAFPETWRDKAFDLNAKMFDVPLAHAEAKKTIASAGKRDYRYRCKEEPCRSLCQSFVCVTRKYGITPDEKNEMEMGAPPEFGPLIKFTTEPVRWELMVDGVSINLSTMELMDYRHVRQSVAENLTRLIAPMKNDRWQIMLHKLMQEATVREAPREASAAGLIFRKLEEFIAKGDLSSDGTNISDREVLFQGAPVVQLRDDKRVVYFRAEDFVGFLKKTRSEDLKGPALYFAMGKMGMQHTKLRVRSSVISVWYVPISDDAIIQLDTPDFTPEI